MTSLTIEDLKRENQRLNDTPMSFFAPNELVEQFKAKCKAEGINMSQIFRNAMELIVGE